MSKISSVESGFVPASPKSSPAYLTIVVNGLVAPRPERIFSDGARRQSLYVVRSIDEVSRDTHDSINLLQIARIQRPQSYPEYFITETVHTARGFAKPEKARTIAWNMVSSPLIIDEAGIEEPRELEQSVELARFLTRALHYDSLRRRISRRPMAELTLPAMLARSARMKREHKRGIKASIRSI